jgi:CubicO group peptidase (beta-lactamase class C family)
MTKIQTLVSAFSLFACASIAQPHNFSTAKSPEEVGFSADRLKRLDTWMQDAIDKGQAPQIITFVARHGKIVHHKAVGFSNLEKKTPAKLDDIYRIASQSKAVTSAAVMMLYEEGKIMLDEPISRYISAFKNPRVLVNYDEKERQRYTTRPAKSEITIRHLLTHTAGIPYEHPLQDLPEFKVPFFNSVDKDVLSEVIPRLAKRPLVSDPGEAYVYGLNTDILGYLVEIVSGVSLDNFFKTRILTPLSMNDTYFYLPTEKANRLVELYSKLNADTVFTLHQNAAYRHYATTGAKTYYSGGAGLVATIEDYAKLCQMYLNKGKFNNQQLLSPSVIATMTKNQIGNLSVWDRKDKFGFGFEIATDSTRLLDPAAAGTYMWGGMYNSEYTIDPANDMILLVFTNVHPYARYGEDIRRKFRTLVYQALVNP